MFEPSCSHTGNSTQFMGWRDEAEAHTWSQIQFVLWDSRCRGETKVLQEGGEEDEELHPGQTLSGTNPATWERRQRKTLKSSASTWTSGSDWLNSPTCRKRHEGGSLDKLPIFVQKVSRIKAVWVLPLTLIIQNWCQERIHCGPLYTTQTLKSFIDAKQYYSFQTTDFMEHRILNMQMGMEDQTGLLRKRRN